MLLLLHLNLSYAGVRAPFIILEPHVEASLALLEDALDLGQDLLITSAGAFSNALRVVIVLLHHRSLQ